MNGKAMNLIEELERWLAGQTITPENIEDICQKCFVPWSSEWNGIVRREATMRLALTPKLCTNCKHFCREIRGLGDCHAHYNQSLVTGEWLYISCAANRGTSGYCGHDAKLFEPKEPPTPTP